MSQRTLVVEPVHLRDLPRLVVAPQNRDAIAIAQLERDEQGDRLNRVVPTVDVVAHEEVVGVGGVAADAEEFGEVVLMSRSTRKCVDRQAEETHELTMDIPADRHRTPYRLDI